jgi:transposase
MRYTARLHTSRCVIRYLQEVGLTLFEWPAMSPDMNPIENAWDELGRPVRARLVRLEMLQELRDL